MALALLDTDSLSELLKQRNPQVIRKAAEYLLSKRREFGFTEKITAKRLMSADGAADLRRGEPLRRLAPDTAAKTLMWQKRFGCWRRPRQDFMDRLRYPPSLDLKLHVDTKRKVQQLC